MKKLSLTVAVIALTAIGAPAFAQQLEQLDPIQFEEINGVRYPVSTPEYEEILRIPEVQQQVELVNIRYEERYRELEGQRNSMSAGEFSQAMDELEAQHLLAQLSEARVYISKQNFQQQELETLFTETPDFTPEQLDQLDTALQNPELRERITNSIDSIESSIESLRQQQNSMDPADYQRQLLQLQNSLASTPLDIINQYEIQQAAIQEAEQNQNQQPVTQEDIEAEAAARDAEIEAARQEHENRPIEPEPEQEGPALSEHIEDLDEKILQANSALEAAARASNYSQIEIDRMIQVNTRSLRRAYDRQVELAE